MNKGIGATSAAEDGYSSSSRPNTGNEDTSSGNGGYSDNSDPYGDSKGDSQYENITHSGARNDEDYEDDEYEYEKGKQGWMDKEPEMSPKQPVAGSYGKSWTDRFKRMVREAG